MKKQNKLRLNPEELCLKTLQETCKAPEKLCSRAPRTKGSLDTLQQNIDITDCKPFLAAENTSGLSLLHSILYIKCSFAQTDNVFNNFHCSFQLISIKLHWVILIRLKKTKTYS